MLDFSSLQQNLNSFVLIVEANYRFYQFYANTFVALLVVATCRLTAIGNIGGLGGWILGLSIESVLLAGSRDSLTRYYDRARDLLGEKPVTSTAMNDLE